MFYTGYRPAIPSLIDTFASEASEDKWLRAYAAWSLAALGATEALPPLRQAYAQQANDLVKEELRCAIGELEGG